MFVFIQFIRLLLRPTAPPEVITLVLGTTAFDAMDSYHFTLFRN